MAKRALVVGIASFAEAQFQAIDFADSDAKRVRDALLRIGYAEDDIQLLTNSAATCDAVRLGVKQVCADAGPEDEVILYLSGHGVAYNGVNHFVCHDTRQVVPPSKTLPMRELLETLGECRSEKLLLFLDCCHAGLKLPDKQVKGGVFTRFSKAELHDLFAKQKFVAAFCSCGENEISYTSSDLRQSVWTYYLLKALNGEVPELLEGNQYLNGAKLQDYLYKEVPAAVRKLNSYTTSQTPDLLTKWKHSPLIADLQPVITANADARAIAARKARLSFLSSQTQRVSCLKGSQSNGYPPAEDGEIDLDLNRTAKHKLDELRCCFFDACRRLKYKVAEIDQSGKNADIKTPDFELVFWAEPSEGSPESCAIRSQATITDERCVSRPEIAEFICEHFDSVFLLPRKAMDLRKAAILLEELDYVQRVKIDAAYTRCSFSVPVFSLDVLLKPSEVTFKSHETGILQLADEVRRLLGRLAVDGVDLFAGEPAKPSKARWI